MDDIVFRKIRGRIVPIRLTKKEKVDVMKGAGLTAAGAATSAAAGFGYKALYQRADKFASRANFFGDQFKRIMAARAKEIKFKKLRGSPMQMSFGDMGAKGFERVTAKSARENTIKFANLAKRYELGSRIVAGLGIAAGGAIAGKGIEMMLKPAKERGEKSGVWKGAGLTALGTGVAAASFGMASGLVKGKEVARAFKSVMRFRF